MKHLVQGCPLDHARELEHASFLSLSHPMHRGQIACGPIMVLNRTAEYRLQSISHREENQDQDFVRAPLVLESVCYFDR